MAIKKASSQTWINKGTASAAVSSYNIITTAPFSASQIVSVPSGYEIPSTPIIAASGGSIYPYEPNGPNIATVTITNSSYVPLSKVTAKLPELLPDFLPLVLDDISNQFDGDRTNFNLNVNGTDLISFMGILNNTIVDSKDFDVAIDGLVQSPYVTRQSYPWIVEYDSFPGFRVIDGEIIFYKAPSVGSQCVITMRNVSQSKQIRRYPYAAASIALGD